MQEQLIKKNCSTGEYNDIYPKTILSAITDARTGQTAEVIVDEINHIYLPFKDRSTKETRLQVPKSKRRKGLWITYTNCKGKVITEWYNSNDFTDSAWENPDNWRPYLNNKLIADTVYEVLSWYKI